ncbi:hypothetical protein A3A46_02185 [Candidatus Roizmanbacteria bacterium RIFCSPLOWO2_01_FULL_37_13]|uniref:Uncharacterized protein n=1 Tax=Candidatus Roizmanbacteria bacterium RIFCSPHIGHO2_02_FULL_38_11 TaxID=1802039 RepID=A0A1F7GX33_9BACT|nr:MAG: hypothetical protein A3C25_00840 [Candidatus Roizmanbacteria bacterium RIFCSPHIGHO2_02_FULL_38_11]OGK33480.1 MAG: hypothetical protein A3F58_00795 [Candidatus Roizmanbacteria bacterium RIFCSPHIGHO2_12_FULL_37_9b]OGK42893.1 MAG: hypothetical protein A3A46_02185 [Candidatus Roizmanbacteria bacterium RIFCSPLOWO2_01_FULL_37_13]
MKSQNKQFDDAFHIVSRLTIILPIVIIIFGIALKLSGGSSQQKSFLEYSLTPTPTRPQNFLDNLSISKKSTASAKFSLTGPLNCFFETDAATISAYIKDKKIYIETNGEKEVQNYLLSGDCIYIWSKGNYSGEKICGISQQVGIIEGLLTSNLLDSSFLDGTLNQILPNFPIGKSKDILSSVLNSCKKESANWRTNSILFDIPKNVLFKNRAIK